MAKTNLRCPKCGEAVGRNGSARGVTRYSHSWRARPRGRCPWHGTQPLGLKDDASKGVDKKVSLETARQVRAQRRQRIVVTAAQNATPVDKAFLASLLGYCKARGARLIVIPYRYKNPTSHWSAKEQHDDWWAGEITPYLLDVRINLNANLVLMADVKMQPTATQPLQGFETDTGARSAIVGHPRIALKSVPTPQSRLAKILVSTGAVTKKNYIPSKAGKKAEHHHTMGAVVVELDGDRFHMRRINATGNGSFCDLQYEYSGDKVREVPIAALVMGDTHGMFADPGVMKATFEGPDSIVAQLRPGKLVWHDWIDFYSRNHHHRGEVFINLVKQRTGNDNVRKEIEGACALVDRVTPEGVTNIFVPSNHPDAVAKWVKATDPREDHVNGLFWAETYIAMNEGARWTDGGARTIDPVAYWARKFLKTARRARFPSRNESVMIKGIDVGHHYDVGANGSRGSLKGFTRIGVKSIGGHSHSPGEDAGAMQVGLNARKDLEYASGPSSWMHCDALIYANGKRTLLFIDGDRWHA